MITMSDETTVINNDFSLEKNELSPAISRMEPSVHETCDMSYQILVGNNDTNKVSGTTSVLNEEE